MKAVVVTASGLRPDYIGCYGNQWIHTPALDRLAADGIVFDRHYADCPDWAGARRAWRTGRYELPMPGRAQSTSSADLLMLLRERGVATVLATDGQRSDDDFHAGWDHVAVPASGTDRTLGRTVELALESWALLRHRKHGLLWLDLAILLPPWNEMPEEFVDRYFEEEVVQESAGALTAPQALLLGGWRSEDSNAWLVLQNVYAGAVTYVDAALGSLFNEFRQDTSAEQLLFIVTADHRWPLGEHDLIAPDRPWLHEERIHLPLLVLLPEGSEAGRRVSALTQSVDLMPTLLAAFDVPIPQTVQGYSLLPLALAQTDQVRGFACSGLRVGDELEWAIRTPEWAFLLPLRAGPSDPPRGPQLYVKPDDPWEVNNVLQHHLKLAEQLEQSLREFARSHGQPFEAGEGE